jgi:NADPH:quinone reductase-like Zn-dependent oxidoreductase
MNATAAALPTTAARVETMQAILQPAYGGTDVLHLRMTDRPTPGEGEVLVEVRAAGLDRGTWHLMTGRPYLMRIMGFGFSRPKNAVVGRDVAGVVVQVGPKVTRFAVGDAVFGIGEGSFAEHVVAREDKLAAKPAGLDFAEAAVLGISGSTALQALRDAGRLESGEGVLVIGASGGVGTFAVQIAKAMGATVTGVCSTAKADLVRSLGADRVIDYSAQDFADGTVRYDLILDVGGNTPLSRLRRAMTPTGRLVFVGAEGAGDWTAGFGRPLGALALGMFVKQRFAMLMNREHFEDLERLAALAADRTILPAIDRRCGLEGVIDAMRDLEAGRIRGKVAVVVK